MDFRANTLPATPNMQALIPRIFRYMYDPAPRVREGMERLWAALIPNPRAAVTAHIAAILEDLIAASQVCARVCANADSTTFTNACVT